MKHCGKCGKDKPEDAFRMKGGRLYSMCRRCEGMARSAARVAPLENHRACARCEQVKAVECFAIVNGRPHSYCKPCRSAYNVERNAIRGRKDRAKRRPVASELWPRRLSEALLDVRAKKWGGPVKAGQLRPMVRVELEAA